VIKMKGYKDVTDDPVFLKDGQELELACCDCGETHLVTFEKMKGGLKLFFDRLYPETAKNREQAMLFNRGREGWILKKR